MWFEGQTQYRWDSFIFLLGFEGLLIAPKTLANFLEKGLRHFFRLKSIIDSCGYSFSDSSFLFFSGGKLSSQILFDESISSSPC